MKLPIYMDYQATTPTDPRVLDRMLPYFCENYGNAASRGHSFGWQAEAACESAREQVALLLGTTAREIVFTSGATESNNLAIFGVARAYAQRGDHIITQATEHKAVLDCCAALQREGKQITILPVDSFGLVDPAHVERAISDRTILVSIMLANNEIGTIQPIGEIGAICHRAGVVFHCDAAQGAGSLDVNVQDLAVDLASISAHKMYGPKGAGALFVRRKDPRVQLLPMLHGGGHERGLRSGTLNVPAVVGFGEAARIVMAERQGETARVHELRDRLHAQIGRRLDDVYLNGHPQQRLPGNLNLSFAGVDGDALMMSMRDIAVSSGSACTSATLEPSHVLEACKVSQELLPGAVRFSLGRFNTAEEIDYVVEQVVEHATRLRELARRHPPH